MQSKYVIKYKQYVSIIISMILVFVAGIAFQKFFEKRLKNKLVAFEQEQQLVIEQLNNRLSKINKQLLLVKDENRNLQINNQLLEKKLKHSQTESSDNQFKLEQTYSLEKDNLLQQIANLNKEKSELNSVIKELQVQIKNQKDNTYSLFQAGKLEMELANIEQQLSEYYETIHQKKSNLNKLKEKCGVLRIHNNFCKEYDYVLAQIPPMEQQVELLKMQREDLKQRINSYLSSSRL